MRISSPSGGPYSASRRPFWRWGAIAALLALLAGGAFWYLRKPVPSPHRPPTPLPEIALPTPHPGDVSPTPPMAQSEREPLGPGSSDRTWVRIVKRGFVLELHDGEKLVRKYPIAIGSGSGDKRSQGDRRTPEGRFSISQIQPSSSWTHDFGDGKGAIRGAYGPWFLRLKTGWKGIGIHGTHDPDSIGTSVSEGCIRMHNADVAEIKRWVRPGTPVIIEP